MRLNFVDEEARPVTAADEASSADAVITIAADENQFWVLDWITWSYSGSPTNGNLKVEIGGTTVWEIDITEGGPGHIEFSQPGLYTNDQEGPIPKKNQAMVITLAGAGVVGKLSARYR